MQSILPRTIGPTTGKICILADFLDFRFYTLSLLRLSLLFSHSLLCCVVVGQHIYFTQPNWLNRFVCLNFFVRSHSLLYSKCWLPLLFHWNISDEMFNISSIHSLLGSTWIKTDAGSTWMYQHINNHNNKERERKNDLHKISLLNFIVSLIFFNFTTPSSFDVSLFFILTFILFQLEKIHKFTYHFVAFFNNED